MGSVETAVTIILTGILVVVPCVALFMNHQRKMAEIKQRTGSGENQDMLVQRLDAIQRELSELRNRQNELILQKHDQSPPPLPNVEDRIKE